MVPSGNLFKDTLREPAWIIRNIFPSIEPKFIKEFIKKVVCFQGIARKFLKVFLENDLKDS